eukprot:GHVU01111754.1.p1 GENE.GHVU01111754.1~~GHVU01111754.1.p1  ORF type:complete len:289 (+),score=17.14 GHVU01111754.1:2522-3388(+)
MFEAMDICVCTIQGSQMTCNGQVSAITALRDHIMDEAGLAVSTYRRRKFALSGNVLHYDGLSVDLDQYGDLHVLGRLAQALRSRMAPRVQRIVAVIVYRAWMVIAAHVNDIIVSFTDVPPNISPMHFYRMSWPEFEAYASRFATRLEPHFGVGFISGNLRADFNKMKQLINSHSHLRPELDAMDAIAVASFHERWEPLTRVGLEVGGALHSFVAGLACMVRTTAAVEREYAMMRLLCSSRRNSLSMISIEGLYQCRQFRRVWKVGGRLVNLLPLERSRDGPPPRTALM